MSSLPSPAASTARSITFRLTMAVGTVGLVVFLAVGALLYWALRHQLEAARAHDVDGKADVVQHFLAEVRRPEGLSDLRHHLDDMLIGDGELRVWLVSRTGEMLYGGPRRPRTQASDGGRLTIWREDGVALNGVALAVDGSAAIPAAELLIGVDTRADERLLAAYLGALAALCGLGVVAIAVLGAWIARRELAPVRRLSLEAAALRPEALSRRLTHQGVAQELEDLVHSFNRALDRVQAAYDHLEAFSADVAHELRTPIAAMINGAEVALSRPRTVQELRETLGANLESLRELGAMVNDMLFLAQADRGVPAASLEWTELSELAAQVVDYFDAVLEERQQRVEVMGTARALANPALVRRALSNLLGNATRYTAAGDCITIALCPLETAVRISVRNPGPGIRPDQLPRLFERFFRVDAARSRSDEHHGLGLSIVRAVALMHGGQAFARSEHGVTEVGFTIGPPRGGGKSDLEAPTSSGNLRTPHSGS